MIIVKLQGGLGNQMFQYAAGRALAIMHNTYLKVDLSFLLDRTVKGIVFRDLDLDIFPNLTLAIATPEEVRRYKSRSNNHIIDLIIRKTVGISTFYKEKTFAFNTQFFQLPGDLYLSGYWQSERYFKDIEEILRTDFAFGKLTVLENHSLLERIRNTNSVCLNVRRGDFVTNASSASSLGFIGLDYYSRAVKLLNDKIVEPHYYIFSDDLEWCKANLRLGNSFTFVEHHHAGKKFSDYMQLMSSCKHFLIPNSSFAWWAAWLNPSEGKIVVTPAQWFKDSSINTSDIVPEHWLKV